MAMLKQLGFEPQKARHALDMLLIDRKNEFRELADVIFSNISSSTTPLTDSESQKFILDFSLDVNEAFKVWSGKKDYYKIHPLKL